MQPGKRLIGKVALVTGGASGIGAATARLFALHGASVVLTDSNAALGKAVEKEIVDTGGTATYATQDVRHEARWAEIVADTEKAYGRLDYNFDKRTVTILGVRSGGRWRIFAQKWNKLDQKTPSVISVHEIFQE